MQIFLQIFVKFCEETKKRGLPIPAAQSPFDTTLKNLKIMKHSILTVSPDRVRQNNINYSLNPFSVSLDRGKGKMKYIM